MGSGGMDSASRRRLLASILSLEDNSGRKLTAINPFLWTACFSWWSLTRCGLFAGRHCFQDRVVPLLMTGHQMHALPPQLCHIGECLRGVLAVKVRAFAVLMRQAECCIVNVHNGDAR